jgi:Galactose oxidase, central domain
VISTNGRKILTFAGGGALVLLAGCQVGGTTSQAVLPGQSSAIVVTVSPGSGSVQAGMSYQFTASVQGDSANEGVTWSIQSSGCDCGTIDSTGKYFAPNTAHTAPGLVISATSVSDPTKSGTAIVYVTPAPSQSPISVAVSPGASSVQIGMSFQFAASVQGDLANKGVTWSIQFPPGCDCGTIDSTGKYLAPYTAHAAPGLVISATSVSDPTKSGTAIVYVTLPTGSNGNPSVGETSGRFTVTGNMATARAGHTATLLQDGSVLVAGAGELDIDDLLVSFPLSERVTSLGQVFTTGNLSTPREFHTATLLQNGKVLITGGNVFWGYPTWLSSTASAELYDPSAWQFVAIGDMSVARTGHTASLLADGRVLIFGGTASGTPSAEIYDPSGGTFAPLPSPLFSRSGHTATVLPSGKVLFTGGQDSSGTLATAEVYDPATNTFAAVNSMMEPRVHHTATLLPNGKVLIAGGGVTSSALGVGPLDFTPQLMVVSPSNTAELFDPQTGTFAPAGTMNTGRSSHTATLLPDGTVLLCGGAIGWFNASGYVSENAAEIYDPATGSFKDAGTMNTGKFWHTATLLPNGTVMLLGGIDRDLPLNVVESFK